MRSVSSTKYMCIKLFLTYTVVAVLGVELTTSLEASADEQCIMQNQEKKIPIHPEPLLNKIRVISESPDSVTIEWDALEGAEVYRVFVNEADLADKAATPGPVVKAPCAKPGSALTATVSNLEKGIPYNIYISVERGGEFFAYMRGVDVPGSR